MSWTGHQPVSKPNQISNESNEFSGQSHNFYSNWSASIGLGSSISTFRPCFYHFWCDFLMSTSGLFCWSPSPTPNAPSTQNASARAAANGRSFVERWDSGLTIAGSHSRSLFVSLFAQRCIGYPAFSASFGLLDPIHQDRLHLLRSNLI